MRAASLQHRSAHPARNTVLGMRGLRWLGGLMVLLGTILVVGCGHGPPPRTEKTIEVIVTTPISDEVLDYQDFTGRLDAYRSVDVRPRVNGAIETASFKEGDRVEKGKELFLIDPRPYKADLAVAEANVKLAESDRNLQDLNSSRARRLNTTQSIGREEYDQILASRNRAKASTEAMTATRDRAAIYLGFTKVIAPISGRISRRVVDPGNIVKADDTLLTTIVDDHQVYAYFDVDERTYLDLVKAKTPSSSAKAPDLNMPVLMRLANEDDFTHAGRVDFQDNRLNGNTGTIRLRGVFENPRGTLKSGLFVRIRLPIGDPYKALLIPDEALQSDQGKKFVYVVRSVKEKNAEGSEVKKNRVEYRSVTVGQAIQGLRVIKQSRFKLATNSLKALAADGVSDAVLNKLETVKDQGLAKQEEFLKGLAKVLTAEELQRFKEVILKRAFAEGVRSDDRVIVSGMQRVRPNLEVEVKRQAPPKAPGFPLGKLLNLTRQDKR